MSTLSTGKTWYFNPFLASGNATLTSKPWAIDDYPEVLQNISNIILIRPPTISTKNLAL